MKKLFLSAYMLCFFSFVAQAQLTLDEAGKTVLGLSLLSSPSDDMLTLIKAEQSPYGTWDSCGITFLPTLSDTPFRIYRKREYSYLGEFDYDNTFYGMKLSITGLQIKSVQSSWLPRLNAVSGGAALNVGSYFQPAIHASGMNSTYGIVTAASFDQTGYYYSGYYVNSSNVATRNFYVKADGTVYGKNGLIQSSDLSQKENVDSISSRSALHALTSLHGIRFNYKNESQDFASPDLSLKKAQGNTDGRLQQELETLQAVNEEEGVSKEVLAQMNVERKRKRIGLIAQEVEEVVPEVVRTLPDGTKGVMYSDLVALVIEGMKEMNARIDSLEHTVKCYQSLFSLSTALPLEASLPLVSENTHKEVHVGQSIDTSLREQVLLYQNVPNPFSASTEIVYAVPEELKGCSICLYDLDGQLLKCYTLSAPSGKITINGRELSAGTYIYTLVSTGRVLLSRKMVKS